LSVARAKILTPRGYLLVAETFRRKAPHDTAQLCQNGAWVADVEWTATTLTRGPTLGVADGSESEAAYRQLEEKLRADASQGWLAPAEGTRAP